MKNKYSRIFLALFLSGALVSCSSGPMSAEDLAARETNSDASLWDDEDYKTIAAKACLKYKVVFNNSLGEWFGDWDRLSIEYMNVNRTSGALDDHPKWAPVEKTVRESWYNALNRSIGLSGRVVSTETSLQAFRLCEEIGVDLTD